jgi:hypothetical protein
VTKVSIYYDGSRGPISVSLRSPHTRLDLAEPGIRTVTEGDAEDLLGPLGGGAFSRAIPLAEAAAQFGRPAEALEQLGTTHPYQPAGTAEPVVHLVLDRATRVALAAKPAEKAKKARSSK